MRALFLFLGLVLLESAAAQDWPARAVRIIVPFPAGGTSDAMARLRTQPPSHLADEPVQLTDLALGSPDLPPTDGLLFEGSAVRVVVRPSGTEPKLKCYLQARRPLAESRDDLGAARAAATQVLDALRTDIAAALALSV